MCISPICISSSLLSASNPALPLSYNILHLGSILIIQDNLPNSKFSTESHLLHIDLFFPFIRQCLQVSETRNSYLWGALFSLPHPPMTPPLLGALYKYQRIILLLLLYKWRRKWQPTPVFLPGKFHGQRSLVGYSPWYGKELGMTE